MLLRFMIGLILATQDQTEHYLSVISLIGSSSKIAYRPLPDDPRQRCPDIGLAQKLLGWVPQVQPRDGLRKTVEYFERLLRSEPRDERLPFRSANTAG